MKEGEVVYNKGRLIAGGTCVVAMIIGMVGLGSYLKKRIQNDCWRSRERLRQNRNNGIRCWINAFFLGQSIHGRTFVSFPYKICRYPDLTISKPDN